MSVVGMNSGGACQADNGVAVDADEAPGLANAVALGQVVEDRDGGRFGEVATIQWCALTLGEAGPAGVAVELAELLLFAVVAADREVAGVTFAVERTAGILAAETCEVVHEANWPSARGGDVFGTELRQSRLILRTIPRHGSTYLGHDRVLAIKTKSLFQKPYAVVRLRGRLYRNRSRYFAPVSRRSIN